MAKRRASGFVPYRWHNEELQVFLQRKDSNAPLLAGQLAFFGGGLDGNETPEQALLREIAEELEYTPRNYTYLGQYESDSVVMYTYYEGVPLSFEKSVTVNEGEYGAFFSIEKALADEPELASIFREALTDLDQKLMAERHTPAE